MVTEGDQPRQLSAAEIRTIVEDFGPALVQILDNFQAEIHRQIDLTMKQAGRAPVRATVTSREVGTVTETAMIHKVAAAPLLETETLTLAAEVIPAPRTAQELHRAAVRLTLFLFVLQNVIDWVAGDPDRLATLLRWLLGYGP